MSASVDREHALREEINSRRIYYKRIVADIINRIYIYLYIPGQRAGSRTSVQQSTQALRNLY